MEVTLVRRSSGSSVRYEKLKKLLKDLAAARAARIAAEAAENPAAAAATAADEEITILNRTEPPGAAPLSPMLRMDHQAVLHEGPETLVEEKPLDSLLKCLEPDPATAGAASSAASSSSSSAAPAVSPAVAAAAQVERDCEAAFLRMLDEDAHTVDSWFRSQKRYLREQLAILEAQSRELREADQRAERRIREQKGHSASSSPAQHAHEHASPEPVSQPSHLDLRDSAFSPSPDIIAEGVESEAKASSHAAARARNRMSSSGHQEMRVNIQHITVAESHMDGDQASPPPAAQEHLSPEDVRRAAREALLHEEPTAEAVLDPSVAQVSASPHDDVASLAHEDDPLPPADEEAWTDEQRAEKEEMEAMDAKLRAIEEKREAELVKSSSSSMGGRNRNEEHDPLIVHVESSPSPGGISCADDSPPAMMRMPSEPPRLLSPFSSLLSRHAQPNAANTASSSAAASTATGGGDTVASGSALSSLPSASAPPPSTASSSPSDPLNRIGHALSENLHQLATHSLLGVQTLAHSSLHGVETLGVHARLRMRLLSSRKPWETLRTAFKELYRGVGLLRDFKMHNYTAFVKILKKHDKLSPNLHLHSKCMSMLNSMHIFASPELHHLQQTVESVFARDFNFLNRKEALNSLKPTHQPMSHLVTFRLGLLLGLSLALFVVLVFLAHFVSLKIESAVSVRLKPVLPVYRGLFLVILHLWLWGANVHMFRATRINYQFIFEIDPKTELEGPQVLQIASLLTFLWFLSLDMYLAGALLQDFWPDLVPGYFHLALYIIVLAGALCPFNILARGTRAYIARTLLHIVTTGWGPVAFRDFYTCNQLCSLANALNDLSYGLCFYVSGDFQNESTGFCKEFSSETQWVLSMLPYWYRFLQCLKRYKDSGAKRQLMNAGKYALSLNTTFWSSMNKHYPGGAFVGPWVGCAVVSTICSYTWDVCMDWGLLEWRKPPPGVHWSFKARCHALFLRKRRVLRHAAPYYIAIMTDGVFRLAWVASISVPDALANMTGIPGDYFKSIIYSIEILRRNQWNFYRLENEHWANVDKEKVINIVALKVKKPGDASSVEAAAASGAGAGVASDSAPAELNRRSRTAGIMCPRGVIGCAEASTRWIALRLTACSAWSRELANRMGMTHQQRVAQAIPAQRKMVQERQQAAVEMQAETDCCAL